MGTSLNRRWFNVASAPGTGNVAVGSALAGYLGLGASQDGMTFDGVTFLDGSAWEVRNGCVYTHGTTTLTRGTLEESSTSSAISLSASTTVMLSVSADAIRRYESAALEQVAGPNAATTMQVGKLYLVDGSALTADRTYTLPATAAVGDRVGVKLSSGSSSNEVVLTAASGDTLEGVAGGTEWSRLFITGESVVFRCTVADSTWVLDVGGDGRKPCFCAMSKSTVTNTSQLTVTKISLNTVEQDVGGLADVANGRMLVRRAGRYMCLARIGASSSAITGHQTRIGGSGGSDQYAAFGFDIPASGSCPNPPFLFDVAAGAYVELSVYHASGASREYWLGSNNMGLRLLELLQ